MQRIPENATLTGFELPFTETADSVVPGSAVIGLRLESNYLPSALVDMLSRAAQ